MTDSQYINDSLLNLCYLNTIFYELVTSSLTIYKKQKDLHDKGIIQNISGEFNKENDKNVKKFEKEMLDLNNFSEEIRAKKINKIEAYNFQLNEKKEIEEDTKIFINIKSKIGSTIKGIFELHGFLANLLAKSLNKYVIKLYEIFYFIIKLMEEKRIKKCGDLANDYLIEQIEIENKFKRKELKLNNEKNQLKNDINSLKIQVDDYTKEIKSLKEHYDKKFKESDNKFLKVNEELKESQNKFLKVNEELKESKNNYFKVNEELKESQNNFLKVNEELKESKNNYFKVNEELKEYKNMFFQVNEKLKESENMFLKVTEELKENNRILNEFKMDLNETKNKLYNANHNFNEAIEENSSLKKIISEKDNDLISMKEKCDSLEHLNLDIVSKDLINQLNYDAYSKEISDLKNSNNKLNFQIGELNNKISQLEIDLEKKESKINSLIFVNKILKIGSGNREGLEHKSKFG